MKLEHANITVLSIASAMRFLGTAFPEFRVRGEGETEPGTPSHRHWLHFGTGSTYIALEELKTALPPSARQPYLQPGINHLGFEVEAIDPLQERLTSAGYATRAAPKEPFRKRIYVDDGLGNEWEFVEYLSEDPAKKNLY